MPVMEPFQQPITCRLCSQPYTDPRMLSCLHSFCRECLCGEVHRQQEGGQEGPQQGGRGKKSQQSFKCPTCEKSVSIPVEGVSNLPQNLHLDFEVKVAQYQSKVASKHKVPCDACIDDSSGPSCGFCYTCLKFLCYLCYNNHKRARELHLHTVTPLGEDASKELLTSIKPPQPICSLHDKKRLKFYCKTCNSMMCRDCTVVAHKNHKHIELPSIASSHRDEIKRLLVSAQETVTKLDVAVEDNVRASEEVETSEKEATQTIRQTFDNLHKALDDRMNELLRELHTTAVARTTALGLQREGYEVLKEDINHYSNFASHVVQIYTDHELMALKQLPFTELQNILTKAMKVSLLPCKNSKLMILLQMNHLVRELSDLGHVVDFPPSAPKSTWMPKSFAIINIPHELKVETYDSGDHRYVYSGLQVKAELKSKDASHGTVYGKVEDHKDGTYTITFIPQMSGSHQLLITMDGEHIRNSPYDLQVRASKPDYRTISRSPKQLNTNITSSLCMAIHNSGDIFIGSESNCIYVFNQAGVQKAVIGSAGDAGGQFNKPSGLAIKGDVLYVADCNNHRIQKLSVSGEFLHMFGKLGSGQGEFNSPSAVVVDFNDRLIVGDCGNCRIQVMNFDGTYVLSIDGRSVGFSNITGLAIDPQGNIHVVDPGMITVLTLHGALVKTYAKYGRSTVITIEKEGCAFIAAEGSIVITDSLRHGNQQHSVPIPSGKPKGIVLGPWEGGGIYIVVGPQNIHYPSHQGGVVHRSDILLKFEV